MEKDFDTDYGECSEDYGTHYEPKIENDESDRNYNSEGGGGWLIITLYLWVFKGWDLWWEALFWPVVVVFTILRWIIDLFI